MKAKKIPVTYVLFPDEGHGFARPENSKAFNAVAEGFLGTCLGGRVQPIGQDFKGSSITVPVGAEGVAELAETLKNPQIRIQTLDRVLSGLATRRRSATNLALGQRCW